MSANQTTLLDSDLDSLDQLLAQASLSSDFRRSTIVTAKQKVMITYFKTLIDEKGLQDLFFLLQDREYVLCHNSTS
jgi:hypothetical protein